jgi:hypothetical protein
MTHVILYIIEFNDTCVICHGVQRHMLYYISLSSMTHVKLDSTEFNDTCYTIYHWVHWHICYLPWSPKTHVILCMLEFNDTCTCAVQYTLLTHVLHTNVHMFNMCLWTPWQITHVSLNSMIYSITCVIGLHGTRH